MQNLLTWAGLVAGVFAAVFWFWASVLPVPDNVDTFISALQRISRINAYAAGAASLAAICAVGAYWLGIAKVTEKQDA